MPAQVVEAADITKTLPKASAIEGRVASKDGTITKEYFFFPIQLESEANLDAMFNAKLTEVKQPANLAKQPGHPVVLPQSKVNAMLDLNLLIEDFKAGKPYAKDLVSTTKTEGVEVEYVVDQKKVLYYVKNTKVLQQAETVVPGANSSANPLAKYVVTRYIDYSANRQAGLLLDANTRVVTVEDAKIIELLKAKHEGKKINILKEVTTEEAKKELVNDVYLYKGKFYSFDKTVLAEYVRTGQGEEDTKKIYTADYDIAAESTGIVVLSDATFDKVFAKRSVFEAQNVLLKANNPKVKVHWPSKVYTVEDQIKEIVYIDPNYVKKVRKAPLPPRQQEYADLPDN
jgi:uncharacterized protein (UPF0179 family)